MATVAWPLTPGVRVDTPGCTAQACGIRDHAADYDAADAVVRQELRREVGFGCAVEGVGAHISNAARSEGPRTCFRLRSGSQPS